MPVKKKAAPKKSTTIAEPVKATTVILYDYFDKTFAELQVGMQIRIPETISGMKFNIYIHAGEYATITAIINEMIILENNKTKDRFSMNSMNYPQFTQAIPRPQPKPKAA